MGFLSRLFRSGASGRSASSGTASEPLPSVERSSNTLPPAEAIKAELRQTELRLETLLDRLPYVILYETGGGHEYISRNIETLLGFTAEELTQDRTKFPQLIHPADGEPLGMQLEAWGNAGRPGIFTSQFRVRKRTGEYIWLEDRISGIERPDGGKGLIGVMVDITARHAAQERYQAIVEAADVAGLGLCILVARKEMGTILYLNQAAGEICGRTQDELIGQTATQYIPREQLPPIEEKWQQFLRGELIRGSFETEVLHKDGHAVPVSIGLCAATLEGEPAVIAFMTNITERKRAEEELVTAKIEAEEISRLKSNILSNFSHELRTPLHSILGFSSLLAEEIKEDDLREYSLSIQRSGQRLLSTVTSIIEISAIETTPTQRILYPLVLHEVLRECVQDHYSAIAERGLDFALNIHSENIIALMEKERFRKALEKIMNNAIKFTHSGSIRVELTEGTRIRAHGPTEERALIKIRDTGIGMSQEFIEKAFEKFKQESSGYSREYEGTGLGLPLARNYVKLMNGDISITSELGVGTEVTISLPIIGRIPSDN